MTKQDEINVNTALKENKYCKRTVTFIRAVTFIPGEEITHLSIKFGGNFINDLVDEDAERHNPRDTV